MESNDAKTAGTATTRETAPDPFDKLLFKLRDAYHKERATSSSALFDFILHNGHLSVFSFLFLVLRYGTHVSMYQVLFFVPLIILFLYLYINYAPFLFLEEDIEWIRREMRFLRAISRDADAVKGVQDRVGEVEEIWGSEPGVVSIQGLDKAEAALLNMAKYIASKAESLVSSFKKRKARRESLKQFMSFAMMSENFQQTRGLFIRTKQVKQDMKDFMLMKKARGINVCESLERLRFNTSLLDRSVYGLDRDKWLEAKKRLASAADLFSSVQTNITSVPDSEHDRTLGEHMSWINLQLLLLHPFLKDCDQGIGFESEVEQAWLEELEEILEEANMETNHFLQKQARHGSSWRRVSIISNWKARRKLKKDMSRIHHRFTESLERKETYGFKFIRRDSSKLVSHSEEEDKVLSSVIEWMRSSLEKEKDVLGEVMGEVLSLCDQLDNMHKVVVAEGKIDGRYNSGIAWLKQTAQIAEEAKEKLEKFIANPGAVQRHHLFRTGAASTLIREIDHFSHSLKLVRECIKVYSTELWAPISVVGLEEDIQRVVSRLTTNNEHGSVISIVGIGGVGRTTLAKEIYDHGDVQNSFPCRAWVDVAKRSTDDTFLDHVAKHVLKSLGVHGVHGVHDIFRETKYLLVLDDLTMEELDTLKAKLPATPSESRILLTTRDNNLASQVDSHPHQLRLRTKEESWKLFIQMVQFPLKQKNNLAEEIVGKCGGLPRAILRVGYLMSGKDVRSTEDLKTVLRCITQNDTPLVESYTRRSVTDLPQHLYKCLSYFKLFPKGFEIPARRLIALWVAEELDKTITSEDVALKCLSELIDRNMIQVVESNCNGEVKTCCLPHGLYKRSLQKEVTSMRLVDRFDRRDPTFGHIHGESSSFPKDYKDYYKKLLSVMSFDTREGNNPGEEIGNFLQMGIAGGLFHQLQVLDLERVFRPALPYSIGRLSNLRYLGLRWTYLESVPKSIGDLLNLQSLDIKHTYVHKLPTSVWKLPKLHHLYLNQSYQSMFIRRQASSSMKSLQTLCGVYVDNDSNVKDGLAKFGYLRKLGLAFQLGREEQSALAGAIGKMKGLRSLKLKSLDEVIELCLLEALSGLENLSTLCLFGKLAAPTTVEFPTTLTDVTLSASSLSVDPMSKLEQLPKLKSLRLYSDSYIGDHLFCPPSSFRQLRVLKLWKLQQLKTWRIEKEAMQNLRELEIRSCTELEVPTGLEHLKSLNELKLTNMPEDFIASIAGTKAQLWESVAIVAVNWESQK